MAKIDFYCDNKPKTLLKMSSPNEQDAKAPLKGLLTLSVQPTSAEALAKAAAVAANAAIAARNVAKDALANLLRELAEEKAKLQAEHDAKQQKAQDNLTRLVAEATKKKAEHATLYAALLAATAVCDDEDEKIEVPATPAAPVVVPRTAAQRVSANANLPEIKAVARQQAPPNPAERKLLGLLDVGRLLMQPPHGIPMAVFVNLQRITRNSQHGHQLCRFYKKCTSSECRANRAHDVESASLPIPFFQMMLENEHIEVNDGKFVINLDTTDKKRETQTRTMLDYLASLAVTMLKRHSTTDQRMTALRSCDVISYDIIMNACQTFTVVDETPQITDAWRYIAVCILRAFMSS
jgi:hypothetical protein